jgi:hypothetical protein
LAGTFRIARREGRIEEKPEASIDATGMESHHVSRHFLFRTGRMKQYRRFPKLTFVSHHATHLIAAMRFRYGPCQDSPDFLPAVGQAVRHLPIDRLLGDGAYDVENHHQVCRTRWNIRSTIFPINPRRSHQHTPKTHYRAQLHRRFPNRLYRRRWHAESTISQHKRRLGAALRSRSETQRECECRLRVVTHNLMILARAG